MTIESKKLKARIDQWQVYAEQPPLAAGSDPQPPNELFAWDSPSPEGQARPFHGTIAFEVPAQHHAVRVASETASACPPGAEFEVDLDPYPDDETNLPAAPGTSLQIIRHTSLEHSPEIDEYKTRIEAFERMLYQLQLQLEIERRRAEELQLQLAQEVLRSREERIRRRSRSQLPRIWPDPRDGRNNHVAASRASDVYSEALPEQQINSIKWLLIIAVTAGISCLFAIVVANGGIQ